ncbi:MAG: hypothetical protein MJ189_02065 [Coriobacteriales bacterium]|nr:hypothetical protein [Coriobacteriales bacterium]
MKILVIGKEGRLQKLSDNKSYDRHNFIYLPVDSTTNDILLKARDVDIAIVDAISFLKEDAINNMPNLKLIHSEGVGYQGIDIQAAHDKGVYVCNNKGMNAKSVAEHTIMLMLACRRNLINLNNAVFAGKQIQAKESCMLNGTIKELGSCTVGLIGFGDISQQTAKLLDAFDASVIFYNRSKINPAICKNAKQMGFGEAKVYGEIRQDLNGLDYVLNNSDIVSVHLPVLPETIGICDEKFFSSLKQESVFINTARGELVDSFALISAIENGQVAFAGLDTLADEPVQSNNPILNTTEFVRERLILSPHIAGISPGSFKRGYKTIWSNIEAVEKGQRPNFIVNGL